ncbi:MAG: uroporphyrinogen-III synthase [Balneolaceae bacterium]
MSKILITRKLSGSQLELARKLGLEPMIEPAIRFEFPDAERQIRKSLGKNPSAPWVFTSKNGVRALQSFLDYQNAGRRDSEKQAGRSDSDSQSVSRPADALNGGKELSAAGSTGQTEEASRVIFAVGTKTGEALSKLGVEARTPERQDAVGLADQILQDLSGRDAESRTVIHWCGNLSRPTLQERLSEGGVELIRLEVYRTLLNRVEIPEDSVEGILFFSPSAVESFRKSGGFQKELPELFAIGNTTGELLSMEAGRHVHIPLQPDTEALLALAADVLKERGDSK